MDNLLAYMWHPLGNLFMSSSLAIYYIYILPAVTHEIPRIDLRWIYPVIIFALAYTPRRYFQISLVCAFVVLSIAKDQNDKVSRDMTFNAL